MFTLDVIASTEFSVDLDQHDPNNPFVQNALALNKSQTATSLPLVIASELFSLLFKHIHNIRFYL